MNHNKTNPISIQKEKKNDSQEGVYPKKIIRSFFEFIFSLAVIIVAANLIHQCIFHPFYVIGSSMEPSFQHGNYLFVEKISYRFNAPSRGDVIVFIPPWDQQNKYVEQRKKELGNLLFQIKKIEAKIKHFLGVDAENLEVREYIKRIIGLPGDTIQINNNSTVTIYNTLYPEGFVLNESYIISPTKGETNITLEENEFFVLGDNRPNSSDSRGISIDKNVETHTVPRSSIEGKVCIRLWPLDKILLIQSPSYNL